MNSRQLDALARLLPDLDEAIHAFDGDPMHEEVAFLAQNFVSDLQTELGDEMPKPPK